MRHGIGTGFCGDLDKPLGDQWAGNGGAQQVETFVQGVCAKHREDEIAGELFPQVFDVDFRDTQHLGLLASGFEFLTLTQIGREGYDFAAVLGLKPLENDRRIQPTRIRKHNLFRRGHL